MTIGRTTHPYEEAVPEGKRLRMKDWLKSRIGHPRYPGLVWLDEKKKIFRIPWKHAALHGWDQNSDGALFRDWAAHTGACVRNTHPKQLKATFRCALHSLPDVHEDRTQAKKRGDDACRVYSFDSTSPTTPRRRHIKKRNHKERVLSRRVSQEMGPRQQSQPVNTQYPVWGGDHTSESFQSTANRNNNSNNSMAYQSSERSQDGYFNPQRHWSNPDIPHGLLPPLVGSTNNTETSFQYAENLKTIQHSISVPEIRQSIFTNAQNVYETSMLHPNLQLYHQSDCEADAYSISRGVGMSPLSSDPGYSPMHSSMSASPSLQSPNSFACMGNTSMQSNVTDTVAGVVGSASAAVDGYQAQSFASPHPQNASPYFGEKLLDSLDAVIASGAVQSRGNTPEEISFMASTTTPPHLSQNMPQTTVASVESIAMKDYRQPAVTGPSLHPKVNEVCQQQGILEEQSPANQMLVTHGISPNRREYIESPVGQYATDCRPHAPSSWMSPQHESLLPSASTLLSPSTSPTAKKNTLTWISTNEDAVSTAGQSFDLMQYDTFTGQCENTCPLEMYVDNHNMTAHHSPSSAYGGYCSH